MDYGEKWGDIWSECMSIFHSIYNRQWQFDLSTKFQNPSVSIPSAHFCVLSPCQKYFLQVENRYHEKRKTTILLKGKIYDFNSKAIQINHFILILQISGEAVMSLFDDLLCRIGMKLVTIAIMFHMRFEFTKSDDVSGKKVR